MKPGFIGLGNVGMPLAKNLVNVGYMVTLYDLRHEAAQELLAAGAAWADSPAAVAEQANTVITALPSPAAVETVLTGDRGVFAGLAQGGTWVDMSTNDMRVVQQLAAIGAEKGIATLECPVTGGVPLAHSGEITILAAGEKAVFDRHLPILQVMGGKIIYLGAIGNASIVKVITNMLAFIHLWALGEALALGKQAGIEVASVFKAIRASSGNSVVTDTEGPIILNGSDDYSFTMALVAKDLHLAYELGRELGVPLEMGALTEQIFTRARRRYGEEAWSTQVVKLLEDDLGIDLRTPGYWKTAVSPPHQHQPPSPQQVQP